MYIVFAMVMHADTLKYLLKTNCVEMLQTLFSRWAAHCPPIKTSMKYYQTRRVRAAHQFVFRIKFCCPDPGPNARFLGVREMTCCRHHGHTLCQPNILTGPSYGHAGCSISSVLLISRSERNGMQNDCLDPENCLMLWPIRINSCLRSWADDFHGLP